MLSNAKIFQVDRYGVWIEEGTDRHFVAYNSPRFEPVVPMVAQGATPQLYSVLKSTPATSDWYRYIWHFFDLREAQRFLIDDASEVYEERGWSLKEVIAAEKAETWPFEELVDLINERAPDSERWELLTGELKHEHTDSA